MVRMTYARNHVFAAPIDKVAFREGAAGTGLEVLLER